MRIFLLLLTSIGFFNHAMCQTTEGRSNILNKNEEIVLQFELEKNHKTVTVCRGKNNAYIVYRIINKDKTEFQYPEKPDASSWQLFHYHGYERRGGIDNLALSDYNLTFTHNNTEYTIYENSYSADNSRSVGIKTTVNGKETRLTGDIETMLGSLEKLNDEDCPIHNSAYD